MLQEKLMSAIAQDNVEAVKKLIDQGASLSESDPYGRWPLIEATLRFFQPQHQLKDNIEMIRTLVSLGANINQTWGPNEESALHLAIASDKIEAVRELVAAGIMINAQNADGDTALHIAARKPNATPQMCAYLLSLGLDPKIKNDHQRTALQDASGARNLLVTTVIKTFTNANASLKAKKEEKKAIQKKTPLGQIELFKGAVANDALDHVTPKMSPI